MDTLERLAALVAGPDEEIPLAEAALCIGAANRPEVDLERCADQIAALASRVASRIGARAPIEEQIGDLNRALFVEEGFRGNEHEYDDPRNSFLDAVLDRRTGIPITLCVLYIEVARRCGLRAEGISFPGHFLAKVEAPSGDVVVDAFNGRIIDHAECADRLRALFGEQLHFDPSLLEAASSRAILRRMLTNLKHLNLGRRDYEGALGWCDHLLVVAPDDPIEVRDRGLVLRELECYSAAIADLERFVREAPEDPTVLSIQPILQTLRAQARSIH